MNRRFLSLILAFTLFLTLLLPQLPKASAAFENTYVNTGNQAEDLVGVAMTQVGYQEGPDNDTKYGDWLGFPNLPWCASFISWCAYQAEISPDILARTALANPGANPGFDIPCYHGSVYTPKRGDLFFKEDFSHVGIVYGVDGEDALTIEANTNDDGSDEGYAVLLRRRKISECFFGVPDYIGNDKPHTYERRYDPGHPHPSYYVCTTCGDFYYTATPTHLLDCRYCMSCGCGTDVAGYYKVTTKDRRLVVYSIENPTTKKEPISRKGYLDPDELVYVVAGDRDWGHIIYANSVGYVQMKYLAKFVPSPTELTSNNEKYYKGDTAVISWNSVETAVDYMVTVLKDGQQLLCRNTAGVTQLEIPDLAVGDYEVRVEATDGTVLSETVSCDFRVLQTYTVTFETVGGSGGPGQACKLWDCGLTIGDAVPTKEGYKFFGWNTNLRANFVTHRPGDVWTDNRDATLFAIWQKEDAVPAALQIHTPAQTDFIPVGQPPDTTGLVLQLVYSDGTMELVKEGYTVAEFNCGSAGVYPLTVSYEGLSVSYDVRILPCPVSQTAYWDFGMADLPPLA